MITNWFLSSLFWFHTSFVTVTFCPRFTIKSTLTLMYVTDLFVHSSSVHVIVKKYNYSNWDLPLKQFSILMTLPGPLIFQLLPFKQTFHYPINSAEWNHILLSFFLLLHSHFGSKMVHIGAFVLTLVTKILFHHKINSHELDWVWPGGQRYYLSFWNEI